MASLNDFEADFPDWDPNRLAAVLTIVRSIVLPSDTVSAVLPASRAPGNDNIIFSKALALCLSWGSSGDEWSPISAVAMAGVPANERVDRIATPDTIEISPLHTLRRMMSEGSDFPLVNVTIHPQYLLIARNTTDSFINHRPERWLVDPIGRLTEGQVRQLQQTISQSISSARATNAFLYSMNLLSLLQHPGTSAAVVIRYVLRNNNLKIADRLNSIDRIFDKFFIELLEDFVLQHPHPDSSDPYSRVLEVYVSPDSAFSGYLRELNRQRTQMAYHSISWHRLWLRTRRNTVYLCRSNADVWCALLAVLLRQIRACNLRIAKHDDQTSVLAHANFDRNMSSFIRHMETFSSIFYRPTPVNGTYTPGLVDILTALLGDSDFGLASHLSQHANHDYGLVGSSPSFPAENDPPVPDKQADLDHQGGLDAQGGVDPTPLPPSAQAEPPSPLLDDPDAVDEEIRSVIDDSDEEDDISRLASVAKRLLINLAAFYEAPRTCLRWFQPVSEPIKTPTVFHITGHRFPPMILRVKEKNDVVKWLRKITAPDFFPDRSRSLTLHKAEFRNFQNVACTTGFILHKHCESILMAIIRDAADPESQYCPSGQCSHLDSRCELFARIHAFPQLVTALKRPLPMAVCVKKACSVCCFMALFGPRFVFNVDGCHGRCFRTMLMGASPATAGAFALALYNTIIRKDAGDMTYQSSPNYSAEEGDPPIPVLAHRDPTIYRTA